MAGGCECRPAGLRGGRHEDLLWPIRMTNGSAKGAMLSDKTARQEFGLTQDEIYDAIDAGTLQYRQAYMHGNPWLRLLARARSRPSPGPGTATVTSANSRPGRS